MKDAIRALKLYDRETSGNGYKVRLLLSFLGLQFEVIPVRLKDGKNDVDDAYLELNPRGQIPTLNDNGFILWGSTAILVYLAMRFDPARRWLPATPDGAAQVMQWLELAQNEIASGLFRARAIARFGYAGDLASARVDGVRALEILDRHLDTHVWLAAAQPTIADIACFPYVGLAHEGGFDLDAYPHVGQWLQRFRALENFIAMPGI
ncbi:MAG TPA: glutathione S-transferase family protein [Noviherbaspirillum sp.]